MDCSFALSAQLVTLNQNTLGVTLNAYAYGLLEDKDLVYVEMSCFRNPSFKFYFLRRIAKRSRTLVLAIPKAWGLERGDVVSMKMTKVQDNPEVARRTMDMLAAYATYPKQEDDDANTGIGLEIE